VQAIRVHAHGDPDVLELEDIDVPRPGPGQALVKVQACGVNYIDIYYRTGAYQEPLPATLGREGAGTVEAVGDGVTEVHVGDRVAWAMLPGAYAEYCVLPAQRLVPVPDGVSANDAAAAMLQGMTAHYLTRSTYPLKPGDTCLVHAAAGGVGLLVCQMAHAAGARVIGTVSTEAKAELARAAGAADVILYTQQDFVSEVKRLCGGVNVIYDGVGKTTFEAGFDCLRPRGYMVVFGQSSGKPPAVDPQTLNSKGSLFVTRPTITHYIAERSELLQRAADVLNAVRDGSLTLRIHRTYPLAQAADAHRLLEGRESTGKLVLET
jgi:NADPH2:quinone reductase